MPRFAASFTFIYHLHLWNCRLQIWSPKAGLPGVCCWRWQTHVPMNIPVLKPYLQYQGMPSIRWLLLWNMCEKNRKELCVWLWYFLVGPTDTYIHAHADCMNAHSKSINLSLSLYIYIYNISIYLSFSLAIFLSLSMYMHTYISIQYTCM